MKKLITLILLIQGIFTTNLFSMNVVSPDDLLNSYEKAVKYNEILADEKLTIEKTYNLDFEKDKKILERNSDYKNFQNLKNKYSQEIRNDIEIGLYLVPKFDILLDKKYVLFGDTNDVTKDVAKFLNKVYHFENKIEKKIKRLNDSNLNDSNLKV